MSCAVGLYLTIQRLLVSYEGHFGLVTSYRTIRCRNPEDVRLKKNTGTSTVVKGKGHPATVRGGPMGSG